MASVGVISAPNLPFSGSHNPSVRHFRHALSLDERRSKFKANHWVQALNHPSLSKEGRRVPQGGKVSEGVKVKVPDVASGKQKHFKRKPAVVESNKSADIPPSSAITTTESSSSSSSAGPDQETARSRPQRIIVPSTLPPLAPRTPSSPGLPPQDSIKNRASILARLGRSLTSSSLTSTASTSSSSSSVGTVKQHESRKRREAQKEDEFNRTEAEGKGRTWWERDWVTDVEEVWFAGCHCGPSSLSRSS